MELLELKFRKTLRRSAVVSHLLLLILFLSVPVGALDPNQPANSFLRTHFTTDEGLPGAVIDEIAQTNDGFLWFITNGSFLNRFDGKNFIDFKNPRAITMAVAPDGDLWIGTLEGLLRIPAANLSQFSFSDLTSYRPGPGKASHILRLHFSRSGVLWVGTVEGLFRFEGEQFVAVGPRVQTYQIREAPDGHLLVINEQGFMELNGSEPVPHPGLAAQLGVIDTQIFDVLRDKQGNTWYCAGTGVSRERNGRLEKLGTHLRTGRSALRAHEDEQGTLWFAKEDGLFRATAAGLESVTPGMQVRAFFTDRDGNLWVGTNGDGLYLLKDRAIRMFTTDEGLPNNLLMAVIATRDGSVWTGANCGGMSRFDGTRFQTYNEKNGLLNTCVWALAEDANGDLWIGTWGGGAYRYQNGTFTQYSKGQGLGSDRVFSIVAGRDGSVWFGTADGITRLRNEQFRTYTTADGLSSNLTYKLLEDRAGVIWSGNRAGLDRLVGDRFENFASLPKAPMVPLGEDRDGGFFVYINGESNNLRLSARGTDTFIGTGSGDMVETEDGFLWFDGNPIIRMPLRAFANSRSHDEPLDYESFTTVDGLATAGVAGLGGSSLALTRDGKIWAATPKGLAVLDTQRLKITSVKPSIYLTDVTIGRNTQRADRGVVLPPGTNHVRIDFAAIEISAPQKIRLQYRLDGVDSEWLDAPNSSAIYSYVPVGTHALHIRACNRNGIWDRQGVVFLVTQQPYFYQTRWFIAAMVAFGILLVVFVYRLRVAQISRMLSARFDERLAERTRVAREIHDTLLQTVQGSKMIADHAMKDSADHTRMVRAMEQLATWLQQATEEGRAALHSLRASTMEKNDLAEAFRRAIDECGRTNSAETSFSVNGKALEMHPVVRDEVYRIGYEAIRNACAHSGGSRLEITLEYGHDLTLRISDNGKGIDSEVVDQGKEGHFGLRGMRERAERIGSKFTLVSYPDSGTVITLIVPGRIAFRIG